VTSFVWWSIYRSEPDKKQVKSLSGKCLTPKQRIKANTNQTPFADIRRKAALQSYHYYI